MLYVAIVLFALAAGVGVLLLKDWLARKSPSRGAVYAHGALAATGLILFLVYALQNRSAYPQISLILFIIAALGGFYLFYSDITKKMAPVVIALIHALVAVGGFVTLLLFVFG